jgi:hypothetical protein
VEWLDPGGGVSAVGWAQVARPEARGISRAGSSRPPLSSIPNRRNGKLERARLAEQHRRQRRMVHIGNPG